MSVEKDEVDGMENESFGVDKSAISDDSVKFFTYSIIRKNIKIN